MNVSHNITLATILFCSNSLFKRFPLWYKVIPKFIDNLLIMICFIWKSYLHHYHIIHYHNQHYHIIQRRRYERKVRVKFMHPLFAYIFWQQRERYFPYFHYCRILFSYYYYSSSSELCCMFEYKPSVAVKFCISADLKDLALPDCLSRRDVSCWSFMNCEICWTFDFNHVITFSSLNL